MIKDIRDYLQDRGQASLRDLALHFDTEPEALRGMLEYWVRKGKVTRQQATASCGSGGCSQCDPDSVEIYRWQDAQTTTHALLRDLHCSRH